MKSEKNLDSVKLMRDLRDKLGKKIQAMSSKERIEYVNRKAQEWLTKRPQPTSHH